ncbi:MAG: ISNCY family transposase [Myxococcales bacterium]|nr:ISNCY family transposase [Myxococcales bacterium]MDH3908981.1 ISNCY family transposase [Gammaproteobacteria bacterium]
MTDDLTTLSTREMDRLQVVLRIADRRLTQTAGAQILGISDRQMRRICRRFAQEGAAGLGSKRRGQSNRRLPVELRKEALALVRARYADFGPTLAQEKLLEQHDIRVAPETLRQWMIDDGIWLTRRQRKKRIQQPRHRRDCYGELVQIDGSDHHWFEDRGPRSVLLVYVDDATGKLMALRMCESESAFSYFHATRSYLERHGKPVALYSDKAGVFRVNAKRPKAGDGFTQFGRAMSDLNIDVICANTPAAKGRVERAHQTLQDRLVKELRLRGISTMDDANAYFPEFMRDYNRRFGRVARNDHDAHRPLTERDGLDDIFTWQEERRVTAQLTVHHKRTMYLLEPTEEAKAAARKRVTVVEYEDGRVSIRFQGVVLAARPFHKDGCVTQGSIVENKLLSGALTEIRKRQQQKEQELVRSAKSKREKRIVRDRFAGTLPPPGP